MRMTHLEYARAIANKFGKQAWVTWLTVEQLIDILEQLEAKKQQENLHGCPLDQEIFGFDADSHDFDYTREINRPV